MDSTIGVGNRVKRVKVATGGEEVNVSMSKIAPIEEAEEREVVQAKKIK
jgi:hypothetical protein